MHYSGEDAGAGSMAERRSRLVKAFGLTALACVVAACVALTSGESGNKPVENSMYHMWLGPNGLPLSPRKQRALLFQFCTTNFVTEAEERYCYARLLSAGNPSGAVKYAGQPQYDSEQIVSPLFTFSAPPLQEEEPAAAAPPEAAKMGQPVALQAPQVGGEEGARKAAVHLLATAKLAQSTGSRAKAPAGLGI